MRDLLFLGAGIVFPAPAIREDDPPIVYPAPPPGWRARGPWSSTALESFEGYPDFASGTDRARHFLKLIGRAALARTGASPSCKVFEHDGGMVSLDDLLALVDRDAIDEVLDRLAEHSPPKPDDKGS